MKRFSATVLALAAACFTPARAATVSPLYARGYTVMPEPQRVRLGPADFPFGPDWKLELQGIPATDVAVESLRDELQRRFGVSLSSSAARRPLRLRVAASSVQIGPAQDRDREELARQAYRLDLSRDAVTVSANAAQGLFYGVMSLVQLIKPEHGQLMLPEGQIEDWPDVRMREIYWDDAHHLDRTDALKAAIRQAAFFKMNGFVIKLEGHFEYKSAPALVEPQALSPAELQALTDYGLRYHVQVIPYLDAPAHIAFILKHPEYAAIREYPDSNYELCVTNPDSYKLLFGMYQDLLDANKGVRYFYLSTDEAYYVGMANNNQCREAERAKELGSVGKLLAEFLEKAAGYLHDRGRDVVFWGEYPLKAADLEALPVYLINGEAYGPAFDPLFRKRGIRQMIYTSTEGEEKLFPYYYPLPEGKRLHSGRPAPRRVEDTFRKITFDSSRRDADLIGVINAGWGDMGLHPETFWLGYAAAGAAAWHPGSPEPEETIATFYPLYYGRNVSGADRMYQLMSYQAQFWMDSWDTVDSKARKPIWGNSYQIFSPPRPAHDQTLPLPPAPGADLSYSSTWIEQNARRLELASAFTADNDELLGLLHANLAKADSNRYNLEVFLSVARLCRQNLEMLQSIGNMDRLLQTAGQEAARNQPAAALASVDAALELAQTIQVSRNGALADTIATWQKTWHPRVAEANGRKYLHELDDVKDHLPDRTVDMSYLVYRELQLPFGEWVEQIRVARNRYAQAHSLPLVNQRFDWADLKTRATVQSGAVAPE